jgi:hypothetical protein
MRYSESIQERRDLMRRNWTQAVIIIPETTIPLHVDNLRINIHYKIMFIEVHGVYEMHPRQRRW